MNDSFDKLSDKLREADDTYIETPRIETWTRLEKKLVVERKRRKRNSLFSTDTVRRDVMQRVSTIILLILVCITAGWFIIHEKTLREKSAKEFSELKNLQGVWECRDGKTIDVINWQLINDSCLQATQIIFFENEKNNLSEEKFSITHTEKNNFLFFERNNFVSENNFSKNNLENVFSKKFIFKSSDKKNIEIEMDSTRKNFSLKVDNGLVFLYRKKF